MAKMISYDLNKEGSNYNKKRNAVIAEIKSISGTWCKATDTTWFIVSQMSCASIRDRISKHLDENDEIVVAALTGEAAWQGLTDKTSKWMHNNVGR